MDFVRDLALLAVAGTGILGAAVYVARLWIERSFAQGLEKFRIQTQAVHDAALERFRIRLQTEAFEHQTRFSRLHERRVEELGKVYSTLAAAHRAVATWTSITRSAAWPSMEESSASATDLENQFLNALEESRIWLPVALCERLDEFALTLRYVHNRFGMSKEPNPEAWRDVIEKMEGEVKDLRRQFEEQARALIDPPPPSYRG